MKRPKSISVMCVLGYLSIVFTFPQVFSPEVKKLGVLMPALFGLLVAANFIAYVGIWYFKKWGLHLFLYSYFVKTLISILINNTGVVFYIGQIFSIFFLIVLLRYYPRMDNNL